MVSRAPILVTEHRLGKSPITFPISAYLVSGFLRDGEASQVLCFQYGAEAGI
jgi:hypothetical protein